MLLRVHAGLDFEVPQSELDTMEHLVVEQMENLRILKVPLKVQLGIGPYWGDLE